MNDLSWTMISFVVIASLVFAFFSWLFRGFMMPYLKVKASRGGKVLIKVRNPLVDYYTVGVPEGKVVNVKLRGDKKVVGVSIPSTAFYRSLGVVCVDMDEDSCAVVTRDYNIVSTHDAVTTNNLMVRQKMAPNSTGNKTTVVIVLLCLILLGILVVGFMLSGVKADVEAFNLAREVVGVNI